VREIFEESIRIKEEFLRKNLEVLNDTIQTVAQVLNEGNKILLFGNGGSAADAQHIAAEFVNRFVLDRRPLPAIALTTDSSVLTAISNDFSFEEVFAKQIIALGQEGDAAVGISTSGSSRNVIRGLEEAQRKSMVTIGFGGPAESTMKDYCRHYLCTEGKSAARIQEVHELVGHAIVEAVDQILFGTDDEAPG
jgi:D-sedoheptulose 7-phosphate isomerase